MKMVMSVSIDEDLYNKIKELREKKSLNISKWVRDLLKEALEKEFKS